MNVLGIERDGEGRVEKWMHEWADMNVESGRKECFLVPAVSAGLSIWRAEASQRDDGRKEDRTPEQSVTFHPCYIHTSHHSRSSTAISRHTARQLRCTPLVFTLQTSDHVSRPCQEARLHPRQHQDS